MVGGPAPARGPLAEAAAPVVTAVRQAVTSAATTVSSTVTNAFASTPKPAWIARVLRAHGHRVVALQTYPADLDRDERTGPIQGDDVGFSAALVSNLHVCAQYQQLAREWWVWEDSNHRPHPYQGCALTT